MMRLRLAIAPLCAAALVVSACGDDAKPPPTTRTKAPVAEAPATPETTTAAPGEAPYVYTYNPVAKRDPFRSPTQEQTQYVNEKCNDPLCQWDLDQLQLVAVVTGSSDPFAMVEDPHNRGYIVRRNTKMGKQGGKVTQILRDSVTVTEFWTAPDGTLKPNPLSLQLKADPQRLPEMDLNTGKTF